MELQPPFRKIIHVDMDAFYASVAELDNPELKGKAIAVGGSEERGVVSAASYEARKFGVKSAMSSFLAKQKCPHLIFVKTDFDRYKELSTKIREIFYEYTDLVEPLSLDEAYLDVTENKKGNPSANDIAREIRARIYEETGLRASAGISINKFIAKVASDINKPNGQKTIHPEEVLQFLATLPVNKFYGVGKVTAAKMYNLGIFKGSDLKKKSVEELVKSFGKSGTHYYNIVRGIHNSAVKPNRIRKSIAAERTFNENLSSEIFMIERLDKIADELEKRMKKTQQTRSKTKANFMQTKKEFFPVVKELLYQDKLVNSVRLLGLSFGNLNTEEVVPFWVQLQFEF
jgi:DNA polymerase-4